MLIEICANSVSSAINAQKAGAHRVELCTALDVGGVTPSSSAVYLTCEMLKKSHLDHHPAVHTLIRPRPGDFCYNAFEVGAIFRDIHYARDCGADGIAVGMLRPDGTLDLKEIQHVVNLAGSMSLTFHRAFDRVSNPFECLEQLIGLGFHTILTSGQAPTAWEGRELIRQLIEKAAGRIDIMPGAGINSSNVRQLADFTGASSFHLSAKKKIRKNVVQQEPPIFEPGYWETDVEEVARVMDVLLGD